MSCPVWARIKIFGDIKESLLEELYGLIIDRFLYPSLNGEKDKKKPKESYINWCKRILHKSTYFDFSDGEANYGQFEDLESFLTDNNIIFIRESAGDGGDCIPEVVYFNGTDTVQFKTNTDNVPILSIQTIKDWCKKAIILSEEFKKGNAPLHIENTNSADTIDGIMARYSLKCKQEPSSAELVLAVLDNQYPDIPTDDSLPPIRFVKG